MKIITHNEKWSYKLMLGATTALVIGVTAFSIPSYAKVANLKTPAITHISEREISTAKLSRFIQYVWKESPLVQEAEAKMNAVRSQAKADSKWIYNPELEFGIEDVDGEDKTKTISISQTIDWNGKFLAAGEVAKYEFQAALAELDDARQKIAIDMLMSLIDYQASNDIIELSSRRTKLMERFARLASNSFDAGDIDQSVYNLAQLALSEALIQQADAEAALGHNKAVLESNIGFSSNYIAILPTLPEKLPSINIDTSKDVIAKLPSIRILQAQELAASAAISKARKNRFADPTLSLMGGQDTGSDVVGLSLSIPLNIFNTYKAEVDVAKYNKTANEKSLQAAHYSAESYLNTSKRTYELSARAWAIWKKNGAQALGQQIETLDSKFSVGELSAVDYLVQIQQTLDTEIAAKELQSKAWKAWFLLLKASGNIEQWLGE